MAYHLSQQDYRSLKNILDIDGAIDSNSDTRALNSDYYNIFRRKYPKLQLENAIGYVIFSRPDLNVVDQNNPNIYNAALTNRPEFDEFFQNTAQAKYYRKLALQLSSSYSTNNMMTLLSSYAENFEVSDEVIKTRDLPPAFNDWKMNYAGSMVDSLSAGSVTINYTDDRFLQVYHLHYFWVQYMHLIGKGFISPRDSYRNKKIIDYACSIYFFLTAEDGETILFWTKLTGVYPLNIPSSAFSWNMGEFKQPKYQIQYNYNHKESMNTEILADFMSANPDLKKHYSTGAPKTLYDSRNDIMCKPWTPGAYIVNVNGTYKLRWV